MPRLQSDAAVIHPDCEITSCAFGRYVEIGRGSRLGDAVIGDYSYCDRYCDIANADIGKFSNIASFVRIGATDHPLDRASLHHFLYRSASYWEDAEDDAGWFARRRARRARVGHDTWIGHDAQIKPGITIGNGAVVASGAIVTRDVAPYMIVAGVPAAPLRPRVPQPVADRLQALGWWNWPHDAIRAALDDFRTMTAESFLERYET